MKQFFKKFFIGVGEVFLALISIIALGAAAAAAEEVELAEKKKKVEARNMEAEKLIVRIGDLNNLRGHVARIIQADDSIFGCGYEGRRLLMKEGQVSDEEIAKEFYNFIIKYGI